MRKIPAVVLAAALILFAAVAVAGVQDKPPSDPSDLLLDDTKEAPKPEPKPEPKPVPSKVEGAEPKPESLPDVKPEQPKADAKPGEQPSAQAKKPASTTIETYRAQRGLFLEANPGAFFSLGGQMGSSNAEPYVTAVFGWNFNSDMALGLALGFAANNNNAPKGGEKDPTTGKKMPASGYYADYTVTFLDLNYSHYFGVSPRLAVPARVFAGGSFIANRFDANTNTDKTAAFQPNAGLASGIQYTTMQRHLQVGAELAFFYLITDAVPAIAFYPSVKYNF